MKLFIIRWLTTTVAVLVATALDPGIEARSVGALLFASLLLGVLNAMVRPLLMLVSLPLIVVTLGFFILILNALMLWIVGGLAPGFTVSGFGAAFLGSIIISLVSWLLRAVCTMFTGNIRVVAVARQQHSGGGMKTAQGRVIEAEESNNG